jgi:hypothetical protein
MARSVFQRLRLPSSMSKWVGCVVGLRRPASPCSAARSGAAAPFPTGRDMDQTVSTQRSSASLTATKPGRRWDWLASRADPLRDGELWPAARDPHHPSHAKTRGSRRLSTASTPFTSFINWASNSGLGLAAARRVDNPTDREYRQGTEASGPPKGGRYKCANA